MKRASAPVRAFAGGVALTAWVGLLLQGWVTYRIVGSVGETLYVVLRYFTITTTLLSAIVFTSIAAGFQGAAAECIVAGVALSETLVGIVYVLLLHGLLELSGGSAVANAILHYAVPVLVPAFWAVCTPKGRLRRRHPLIWAIYPLVYLAVAIAGGGRTGRYPYPFLDIGALGRTRVLGNSVGIAAGFLSVGFGLVWLDGSFRPRSAATRR